MRSLVSFVFASVLALSATMPLARSTRVATLDVQNMTCAGCAIAVKTALNRVNGVSETKVNMGANTATVTFDPSKTDVAALTRATAAVGFPSSVRP